MYKGKAVIIRKSEIAKDIFSMELKCKDAAGTASAGQFVNVYTGDKSMLLPRPISICKINRREETLRLVYRVAGKGTELFAQLPEGAAVEIMGPIGNGFYDIEEKKAVLFGGGIGIPPMLGLAEKLHSEGVKVTAVLGYRTNDLFLADEFEKYADVVIATDDGTAGFHGNVVEAARAEVDFTGSCICACGPTPMLRGIKALAMEKNVPAQLSMEERMACGVGACLGCVCQSTEKDHHSNVNNKRVCKDGPVFWAEEIEL